MRALLVATAAAWVLAGCTFKYSNQNAYDEAQASNGSSAGTGSGSSGSGTSGTSGSTGGSTEGTSGSSGTTGEIDGGPPDAGPIEWVDLIEPGGFQLSGPSLRFTDSYSSKTVAVGPPGSPNEVDAGTKVTFMVQLGLDGGERSLTSLTLSGAESTRFLDVDGGLLLVASSTSASMVSLPGPCTAPAGISTFLAVWDVDGGACNAIVEPTTTGGATVYADPRFAAAGPSSIALTGFYYSPDGGTVDFGGGPWSLDAGDQGFVAVYGLDGSALWDDTTNCPPGANSSTAGIAEVDASGNVFVKMNLTGACTLGNRSSNPISVDAFPTGQPFIVAYSADGGPRWATPVPSGVQISHMVTSGSDLYAAGNQFVRLDGGGLENWIWFGDFAIDGGLNWSDSFSASQQSSADDLAVTPSGLWVIGRLAGGGSVGGPTLGGGAAEDLFLGHYHLDGGYLDSTDLGSADGGASDPRLLPLPDGSMIVRFDINGTVDVGDQVVTTPSGTVVLRYRP